MRLPIASISALIWLLVLANAPAGNLFEIPATESLANAVPERPVAPSSKPARYPFEFRSLDGSGNNPIDPLRGSAPVPLLRMASADYGDAIGWPSGSNQKSSRLISNLVVAQDHDVPNDRRGSDYLWQWGQFLDHDMDLTPAAIPTEFANVRVPLGDPQFDPTGTGAQIIELTRSLYQFVDGVREQINTNTAFIDASQIYGCEKKRADDLRAHDGTGRLRTSPGNLLPYNENRLANAPTNDPIFFIAGDVRANEQVGLTAMHTLFMREHNYWADRIRQTEPGLDDDGIYFRARAIVGAEVQIITYRDFLPTLLGNDPLPTYQGYRPEVDPGIANIFSTAAFRVGHTMLSPVLRRLDSQNRSIGDLPLANAFFNPSEISGPGIEPYLRGLARQRHQKVDCYLVDGVRNFLFGPPGAGGFDLASLNIQRGRDHALPRYNVVRAALGLPPKTTFAQVTNDPDLRTKLAAAYATPSDMDVWIGALAENPVHGGHVGELVYTVLADQFRRLRDGDRFWYQTYLPASMVHELEDQPLSAIICRNTTIGSELDEDVFEVPSSGPGKGSIRKR